MYSFLMNVISIFFLILLNSAPVESFCITADGLPVQVSGLTLGHEEVVSNEDGNDEDLDDMENEEEEEENDETGDVNEKSRVKKEVRGRE